MLCELSNTIVTYALTYTDNNIHFTKASSISSFGPKGPPANTARAGHFELLPDNKHIYVSNRLTGQESDGLAHFRITHDKESHPILDFVSEVPTKGILPRMFCVLDKGKGDIVATNEKSDFGVLVFGRDGQTGALEPQPKLKVPMSEFMNDEEREKYPGNGPKFVMEV